VPLAVLAVVAALGICGGARAETSEGQGTVPPAAAQPATIEQTIYAPPNRWLIAGGVIGFVGAYVPAVIVAVANSSTYNNQLYIPVAGPWLDLDKRPQCGNAIGQTGCGTALAYQIALIVDGVVQALGVAAIGVGAVIPEKRTHVVQAKVERPRILVAPTVTNTSAGAAVVGAF
jgi:hypothetical protein